MSKTIAHSVESRVNLNSFMVAPQHLPMVMQDLNLLSQAETQAEAKNFAEMRGNLADAYGFGRTNDRLEKPFAFTNGVAIIPIHGTLINRFGCSWSYVTGYNFIRSQLYAAMQDADVELVVFDVNSSGGEVAGCFELAAEMYALRTEKPTLAVVDSRCYSAAYALACACSKVVVTPSGGAGSIGVVATHISIKAWLEKVGGKYTMIYAGAHKIDGNPYEDLPESVRKDIQSRVDRDYAKFIAHVATCRNMSERAVRDTEARCYTPEDALSIGLIDAVMSPVEAVSAFINELSTGNPSSEENPTMTEAEKLAAEEAAKQEAAAAAAAAEEAARKEAETQEAAKQEAAAAAERERIAGILGCEEAKGKPALANHLALSGNHTVEAARAILAAAAPEAAPKAQEPNPFTKAMNDSKNPSVGADSPTDEGNGGEQTVAQRILANQAVATGIKLQ